MGRWAAALIGTLTCWLPATALADRAPLTLLPVSIPEMAEDETKAPLAHQAEVLSDVLADAAYDQGFELKAPEGAAEQRPLDDEWLVDKAQGGWVVSPRIEQSGSQIVVRLVAVAPDSRVLLVRSERMESSLIEVRGVVMLRDLLEAGAKPSAGGSAPATLPEEPAAPVEEPAPRSAGRAVLALNAAVLGGYVGFSLQKASGSDDERLIYPLAALGAGIGLGASLLVADEWDVGVGDAWYVAAGAWWPAAGGLLLAESYDVAPEDRYVYGIIGASAGIAAATAATATGRMAEGDATVAHSGGAFGMGLGGLTELLIDGHTESTPVRGMGYGAISGVLLGGALATQMDVPTSRVLLIDLGASLGALGGAAAASPLLIVEDEPHPTRTRLWLSSVAVGTLAGGSLAWWLTRGSERHAALPIQPFAGAWPEEGGGAGARLGVTGSF